jgi:uncharacterized protein
LGVLTEEMQRFVAIERLGFMATVCPDGTPNLSPKGTTAVYDDDHLVFIDLRSPGTIRNLRENPSIEINMVDVLSRKGFRFKGTASVHTEGEVVTRALEIYGSLGLGDYTGRMRNIVLVKVERALPITSPAYDLGRTEADLRAEYGEVFTKRITGA